MSRLDVLIAKRVMGWHQELYAYPHVEWQGVAWRDADGHWKHEVGNWSPSTCHTDALAMWSHVTGSGNQYLLVDDSSDQLIVGLEIRGQDVYIRPTGDINLALCRAALRFTCNQPA